MNDLHKQRISASCKGKTKNNGTVWLSKDGRRTRVSADKVDAMLADGWIRGKITSVKQVPWNKGLTAESDERVRLYIEHRKK